MIEEAVKALLASDSAVGSFVGMGVSARIYPVILPQGAVVPALTYRGVSNHTVMSHDGPGLQRPRVEINAYAPSYGPAKALTVAVRRVLCPRERTGPADYRRTVGGVEIQAVFPGIDQDFYEPDTKLFRIMSDFFVHAAVAA